MVDSSFIFEQGDAIEVGSPVQNDFVYQQTNLLSDGNQSFIVFINGRGLGPGVQIIDNFEDNDLSEYNITRGSYDISTTSYNGNYALHTNTDLRSDIYSSSGLDSYPQAGDTFSSWVRADGAGGISLGFGGGGPRDWNMAQWNAGSGEIRFQVVDNRSSVFTQTTSVSANLGEWYEMEVEWSNDGVDMHYKFKDGSGNILADILVSESTHNTGGVVGFESYGQSGGEDRYMDYITKA